MTTRQQLANRAARIIELWQSEHPTTEQVCSALTHYSNEPDCFHLTPLLVTACRLAGLLGA